MDSLHLHPEKLNTLRLGIVLPAGQAMAAWNKVASYLPTIERHFDGIWLRDVPFTSLPAADRSSEYHIFVMMAVICSNVTTLEIGTAVISTFGRDPIDIARAVATTHALASTEILVGLGPGTLMPPALAKSYKLRRGEFAQDYLAVYDLLSGKSRSAEFPIGIGLPQEPKRPRMFAATNSAAFWRNCGLACNGWITYAARPATIEARIANIRRIANNQKLDVLMQLNLFMKAEDGADAVITSVHGVSALEIGPSMLSSLFSAYSAAGVSHLLLYFPDDSHLDEQIELVAQSRRDLRERSRSKT